MARTHASVAATAVRIEDEVWEEAFSSRVPSRRRASPSARPARAITGRPDPAGPALRLAEAPAEPAVTAASTAPPAPAARRTVRIQGRGADPYRSDPSGRTRAPHRASPVSRSVGASPDRLAMWAAMLGFLLVLVAILSSHF
jgi:hypothetical protein